MSKEINSFRHLAVMVTAGFVLLTATITPAEAFTVSKVPMKYSGAGQMNLYDCSDKCGSGMFRDADCDPNKCEPCLYMPQPMEVTLLPSKSLTLVLSHACPLAGNCNVIDPTASSPVACVETLSGTYDSFGNSFEVTAGSGRGGYYKCEGGGRISDVYFTIDSLTCKNGKGQAVFDTVGTIGLVRLPDEEELEESGARFSGVTGQVETRPDSKEDAWKLADLETVLYVRDHIRTQEDSSAIVGFADMSTFVIKPETEVVVTTPPQKDSKLKLVFGNILVNVKSMIKTGSMEVEMNQAVAGIKGTTFVASETAEGSRLKVIEGEVVYTSKKTGEVTLVKGGETALVDPAGVTTKSTFDAGAEQREWEALVSAPAGRATEPAAIEPTAGGAVPVWKWLLAVAGAVAVAIVAAVLARRRRKQ